MIVARHALLVSRAPQPPPRPVGFFTRLARRLRLRIAGSRRRRG